MNVGERGEGERGRDRVDGTSGPPDHVARFSHAQHTERHVWGGERQGHGEAGGKWDGIESSWRMGRGGGGRCSASAWTTRQPLSHLLLFLVSPPPSPSPSLPSLCLPHAAHLILLRVSP